MCSQGAGGTGVINAQVADNIHSGVVAMGQELPPTAAEKLAQLLTGLQRWGAKVNLTAIRDLEAMVPLHILDSLAVRPWLSGSRVLDVGTGAGFPGLPLAIAEPDTSFVLLDSSGRKIAFVRHMIGELKLTNVELVNARAEHYAPDTRFGNVVARAFAAIPQILELAGHLVAGNGVLLALKGKYPQDELRQLEYMTHLSDLWGYNVTELTVPGLESHARHLVALQRRQVS